MAFLNSESNYAIVEYCHSNPSTNTAFIYDDRRYLHTGPISLRIQYVLLGRRSRTLSGTTAAPLAGTSALTTNVHRIG